MVLWKQGGGYYNKFKDAGRIEVLGGFGAGNIDAYFWFMWFFQMGFSIPLTDNNYYNQPFMFSTGLQLRLWKKYTVKTANQL
jgi:hypothetical protein